ncbi:acetate--CoA ligase family protein [Parasphingopyxis sp. GrpM-11]|uniref:Acetate--CoA ligase family protein n=2 Tax=Parasphingopyxis marina TaxID=2761622 RepID=A0A842HX44_9SPHN|nr:acetate--CoA ligase family protein [Parasphingopyxis marina]
MRPRSIAIVGASAKPGSTGSRVLANLQRFDFAGDIHLVSRKGGEIDGRESVTSLTDLPPDIDLAILAIPGAGIGDAVAGCVERGIGAAVVYSSGFAEMGAEGRIEQDRIAKIARDGGLALLGPNCIGLTNFIDGTPLSFGVQRPAEIAAPAVAILGQSGGMVGNIRLSCAARELPVSYTISTGNEAVLSINDFVEFAAANDATRVIAVFAEQLRDPQRFLALAKAVRQSGKQIVLIHPGESEGAQEAAASHTGSLVTDHAVMRTLVTEAGVILVETLDEMGDVIELLLRSAALPKAGPAIVTESGAFKGLAADMCARLKLDLPILEGATGQKLAALLPDFAHVSNPLDITAQGLQQPDLSGQAAAALLADRNVGSVLMALMPGTQEFGLKVAEAVLPHIRGSEKPVVYTMLGDSSAIAPEIASLLHEAGIALFRSPDRALRALARLHEAGRYSPVTDRRNDAVKIALPDTSGVLPEYLGKALLASAGFTVPAGRLATSAKDAVAAAAEIGRPVAMKAQASALSHKSDIGAVALGLEKPEDIAATFEAQVQRVAALPSKIALDGILVEAMQPRDHELIVSARRDDDWGPILMVGLGGIWIEVLKDVAMLGADSDREAVLAALRGLKGYALLKGARGQPPADLDAIADTVARLGVLIRANPRIKEIEINPLSASGPGEGAVVLDALVTLA